MTSLTNKPHSAAPPTSITLNNDYAIHWSVYDDVVTLHTQANHVFYDHTGKKLEYWYLIPIEYGEKYKGVMWNRLGCLDKGYKKKNVTNLTIFKHAIKNPKEKNDKYVWAVCYINNHKAKTKQVCFTAGGNLADQPGSITTPTSYITTFNTHWNTIITIQTTQKFAWMWRIFNWTLTYTTWNGSTSPYKWSLNNSF